MQRLCEILRSKEFVEADPILQASFAHYAFVRIHPFADGNGRVARALASVYTTRAFSVPLMILADQKDEYLDALQLADKDDYSRFIGFVGERLVDAIDLVAGTVRSAQKPDPSEKAAQLAKLYITRGGYHHERVDAIGNVLLDLVESECRVKGAELNKNGELEFSANFVGNQETDRPKGYRRILPGPSRAVVVSAKTFGIAEAIVHRTLYLSIPIDCGPDDQFLVHQAGGEGLRAKYSEISPKPTLSLFIRTRLYAHEIISEMMNQLQQLAEKTKRDRGYS